MHALYVYICIQIHRENSCLSPSNFQVGLVLPVTVGEVVKPFSRHREACVVLHPSRSPSLSSLTVIFVPQATLQPPVWHQERCCLDKDGKAVCRDICLCRPSLCLSHQRFLPNAVCADLPSSRTWWEQTCLLGLSVKVPFLLSCANASISGWQNATWDDGVVCSLVFR